MLFEIIVLGDCLGTWLLVVLGWLGGFGFVGRFWLLVLVSVCRCLVVRTRCFRLCRILSIGI